MKYHIEKQGDEIVISFRELGGQAQAVIDAIDRCRQRTGACPSGECTKIGMMETCGESGELAVRLKARPESNLSVASVGECLKYQLPKEIEV
jgi:hypothetical protein